MSSLINISLLFWTISQSVSSTIWPMSFFVYKYSVEKKIILLLWALTNLFIWIWLIVCQVVFCYTIITCLSGFWIKIIITILLFSLTILLLLRISFLNHMSIIENDLLSYYCICFVEVMTDINWFHIPLL